MFTQVLAMLCMMLASKIRMIIEEISAEEVYLMQASLSATLEHAEIISYGSKHCALEEVS